MEDSPAPHHRVLPSAEKEKASHRHLVAQEVLSTESSYVASLTLLIEVYYIPLVGAANGEGVPAATVAAKAAVDAANHAIMKNASTLTVSPMSPGTPVSPRARSGGPSFQPPPSPAPSPPPTAPPSLSMADITTVFSNVQIILRLNAKFLEDLSEILSTWDDSTTALGGLFKSFSHYFKMYSQYVTNHEQASKMVASLESTNKGFREFCADCVALSKGLSMASLLIMPIQRIPRYKLLLQEFLKHTPREHPDFVDVEHAMHLVNQVAVAINTGMVDAENRRRMLEIQSSFDNLNDLVCPTRTLRKQGEVWRHIGHMGGSGGGGGGGGGSGVERGGAGGGAGDKEKGDGRVQALTAFLFNDLLVLSVHKKSGKSGFTAFKKIVLDELTFVQDMREGSGDQFRRFRVVSRDRSFLLYAADSNAKVEWISEITRVLKEQRTKTTSRDRRLTGSPLVDGLRCTRFVEVKGKDVGEEMELMFTTDAPWADKEDTDLGDMGYGSVKMSMWHDVKQHTIGVVVNQAKNLKVMDVVGTSDPYVVVTLHKITSHLSQGSLTTSMDGVSESGSGSGSGSGNPPTTPTSPIPGPELSTDEPLWRGVTRHQEKDLDPVFNEAFCVPIPPEHRLVQDHKLALKVQLWDRDVASADDFIGSVIFDVSTIPEISIAPSADRSPAQHERQKTRFATSKTPTFKARAETEFTPLETARLARCTWYVLTRKAEKLSASDRCLRAQLFWGPVGFTDLTKERSFQLRNISSLTQGSRGKQAFSTTIKDTVPNQQQCLQLVADRASHAHNAAYNNPYAKQSFKSKGESIVVTLNLECQSTVTRDTWVADLYTIWKPQNDSRDSKDDLKSPAGGKRVGRNLAKVVPHDGLPDETNRLPPSESLDGSKVPLLAQTEKSSGCCCCVL